MSLATWKAEFYPVPADAVQGELAAVKHSLKKWRGLLPENRHKHGVEVGGCGCLKEGALENLTRDHAIPVEVGGCGCLKEGKECFVIGTGTCALCVLFYEDDRLCPRCPLKKVRDERCDNARGDEEYSPWFDWVCDDNPEPMIKWLERALDLVEGKTNK